MVTSDIAWIISHNEVLFFTYFTGNSSVFQRPQTVSKQSDLRHGQVTPQRWVIERSFSWLGKYRRLWRNCERKLNTSKMMISLAFLRILLKRF
ncbi:transposase [Lactiplantibacillus plantarum]|uniref:transposase n=1 Tax=Lactiplantibacillus plantarum TaxID=1590 RepID=UPI0014561A72|nr:transposase [Lactiplantibacillus plantarum]